MVASEEAESAGTGEESFIAVVYGDVVGLCCGVCGVEADGAVVDGFFGKVECAGGVLEGGEVIDDELSDSAVPS